MTDDGNAQWEQLEALDLPTNWTGSTPRAALAPTLNLHAAELNRTRSRLLALEHDLQPALDRVERSLRVRVAAELSTAALAAAALVTLLLTR